ncbi:hypothetical protein D3C72_1832240 [compost metagenome]
MGDQRRFVEGLDAQAQVVDVAPFAARPATAVATERAVQADQIDHRRTRTQVHQAQVLAPPHHSAPQHLAIEGFAAGQLAHPQHHVVDAFNAEGSVHAGFLEERELKTC